MLNNYKDLRVYLPSGAKILRRDDLRYTQGRSDKVYIFVHYTMPSKNGGLVYCVNGLYGRYGNNLQVTEICQATSQAEAGHVMEQRMSEKLSKGYVHLGTAYPQRDETQAQDLSHMARTLRPGVTEITQAHMMKEQMASDQFIIEQVGNIPFRGGMFSMFAQFKTIPTAGWYIYNIDGTIHSFEPEAPGSIQEAVRHQDNVYGVYLPKDEGRLILMDLYHLGEAGKFIGNKPWKMRRTMLTEVFKDIFPNRDPYDNTYYAHLSDYIHADKQAYVDRNPDYYIIKSIESTLYNTTHAFQG